MAINTGSKRRSTSIKCNDALILPHRANQAGSNFREPQAAGSSEAIRQPIPTEVGSPIPSSSALSRFGHGLQVVALPHAAHAGGRYGQPAFPQFVGDRRGCMECFVKARFLPPLGRRHEKPSEDANASRGVKAIPSRFKGAVALIPELIAIERIETVSLAIDPSLLIASSFVARRS